MIAIIDYGGANLGSVIFALERLGYEAQVTSDPIMIKRSSHVILPGVASAKPAMEYLEKHDLVGLIRGLTQPVLGICLGLQLLFDSSEEGNVNCLKIIRGIVEKIKGSLPLPHMGWNTLSFYKSNALFKNIPDNAYMYFVHSYAVARTVSS